MATPEPTPDARLRGTIEQYAEDLAIVERHADLLLLDEHVGRRRSFLESRMAMLDDIDFDGLTQSGRIDVVLLRNHLAHRLRLLDRVKARSAEMDPLIPFASDLLALEVARRDGSPSDGQQAAATLTALESAIGQVREKPVELSHSIVSRAVKCLDKLREALKKWFEFYNTYDPAFTWWVSQPHEKAAAALEGYADFLRKEVLGIEEGKEAPLVGDPIGEEALLEELTNAMIPYSPEELIAIGEREMAWCEAEMARAAADMGCDDWHEALERVKSDHVPPGEQPRLIRDLAVEAVEFLEQNDLVTIPPLAKSCWWMDMMAPERQKVNPFFTGGETISVSYPTSTMSHDDKLMSMRGNNVHFARATVHHELIPGHHLQGFMARRLHPYRRVFRTPFYLEGWALWWEMLLWDLGFPKSPENRVGMLFWRMHRCARIVFSLRFHLGQMTPQECVDMLVTRVGHERANAEGEIRRSVGDDYPPLYQCAYMVGGLQLGALYGELVAAGEMTAKAFHDAVLAENCIPIELVRASLTGQELRPDFQTSWRFADRG